MLFGQHFVLYFLKKFKNTDIFYEKMKFFKSKKYFNKYYLTYR